MREPTPAALFAQLQDEPGAVWLDGGLHAKSLISWEPEQVSTQGERWDRRGAELTQPRTDRPEPFSSGVIGYIGYGAGHRIESVPKQGQTWEPEVWLGRYAGGATYDNGQWIVRGSARFRARFNTLRRAAIERSPPPARPHPHHTVDRKTYCEQVQQVLDWIQAGECYQVNLSRPVFVESVLDPWATYCRLRERSDASMGAYLVLNKDTRILSNSPEMLLRAEGKKLRSDPIKGTRPRSTGAEDVRLRTELLNSEKDHAELAMIVDLIRNDLGKVADFGTVHAHSRVLRSHATVHHTSWPVTATLRAELDSWHALAALFPPGSVTGAPKIRASEYIHTLERTPRGVYCGAIGFCSDTGSAAWSVAIRTAVWHRNQLRYHVGGGIVADSSPEEEYEETVAKGRALAEAIGLPR